MRLLGCCRRPRGTGPARAERFVAAGAERARGMGHEYVGTEHVLLALAEEPTTRVGRALASLDVTGDVVRRDIERIVGTCTEPRRRPLDPDALATLGIDLDEVTRRVEEAFGPGALERSGPSPRSAATCRCIAPRLERALERAAADAGDGPVGAEHVVVALAAVEDCVAARILRENGVSRAQLRRSVHSRH